VVTDHLLSVVIQVVTYLQHWNKRPKYAKAIIAATTHSKVIDYIALAAILCKDSLELDLKKYNNLQQDTNTSKALTKQEEFKLLLRDLKQEGLHPCVKDKYVYNT
jgi:hypothetical protein